jgi:hypothetical protein
VLGLGAISKAINRETIGGSGNFKELSRDRLRGY